jgi:PPK2 family polyphosphate:nucleotide phosphotransferase
MIPTGGNSKTMKIKVARFRIRETHKVRLSELPTSIKPVYKSKSHYEKLLATHVEALSAAQSLLYAHNRYALLLIFQGVDAAGKDSAINHVMSGVNPQGCEVSIFKRPSESELQHDFLWRTTLRLPERGHIGIFNRSYYEEVLIVRVHPDVLRQERLPAENQDDPKIWRHRFHSIVDFEKHLHRNGTRVVKFFLHLSKEEQRRRFLSRVDDPHKNWKITQDDLKERAHWKDYQRAYEDCLAETSAKIAPWYVVPADDKKNARLIISQVILDTLGELKMSYPNPGNAKELESVRKQLEKEKD